MLYIMKLYYSIPCFKKPSLCYVSKYLWQINPIAIFDATFYLVTFNLFLSDIKQTVLRRTTVVDCDSSGCGHMLF